MSIKNQKEYNWIADIIKQRNDLLREKDNELGELYRMCDNPDQIELISDLLARFDYVSFTRYAKLLKEMSNYIKNLGYQAKEIAIISMAKDEDADSSQSVVQDLKVMLCDEFGERVKDCNMMTPEALDKRYNAGCRHFIAVDEFTGTGSTVIERNDRFRKIGLKGTTIEFCFLSGMQAAVDNVQAKGINIKVFNILQKGISDFYNGDERSRRLSCMTSLEAKLAERIKSTKLSENSFGFRESESLYYKELGNIPNNVFPIFWWKQYRDGKKRRAMFTRVQNGY